MFDCSSSCSSRYYLTNFSMDYDRPMEALPSLTPRGTVCQNSTRVGVNFSGIFVFFNAG